MSLFNTSNITGWSNTYHFCDYAVSNYRKNFTLGYGRDTHTGSFFLNLNIALCSVLKNPGQCIESVCYATNLYSTHPWLLNFEIMLKIVPTDGIGLSE
jgi:hypothetical protein